MRFTAWFLVGVFVITACAGGDDEASLASTSSTPASTTSSVVDESGATSTSATPTTTTVPPGTGLETIDGAIGLAPVGDLFWIIGPISLYDPVADAVLAVLDANLGELLTVDGRPLVSPDEVVAQGLTGSDGTPGAVVTLRSPDDDEVTVLFIAAVGDPPEIVVTPLATESAWRNDDGAFPAVTSQIVVAGKRVSVGIATGEDPLKDEYYLATWDVEELFELASDAEPIVSRFEPKTGLSSLSLVGFGDETIVVYGKGQGSQKPDGAGGVAATDLLTADDPQRGLYLPKMGWAAGTVWKTVEDDEGRVQLIQFDANGDELAVYDIPGVTGMSFDDKGAWVAGPPRAADADMFERWMYRIDKDQPGVVATGNEFRVGGWGRQIVGTPDFVYYHSQCLDRATGEEHLLSADWAGGYLTADGRLLGMLGGQPQILEGCPSG